MALIYKCVELTVVTDETLEQTVNQWVVDGWSFERAQFVTSEASRRPVMAFVWFVRDPERAERADRPDPADRAERPERPERAERPDPGPKPPRRVGTRKR